MNDTSNTPKLSALVVAHNEESDLDACLASLAFADELVVVLDRCTDGSLDIARAHNARIEEGAWEIEGHRRNLGIEICSGDWILEVDADERVSPALASEIRETIGTSPYGHFLIPYHNYVGDRLVEFGWGPGWGVSATVRLFAKDASKGPAKRWGDQRIHPALVLEGEAGRLREYMMHYVDRDISDMLSPAGQIYDCAGPRHARFWRYRQFQTQCTPDIFTLLEVLCLAPRIPGRTIRVPDRAHGGPVSNPELSQGKSRGQIAVRLLQTMAGAEVGGAEAFFCPAGYRFWKYRR